MAGKEEEGPEPELGLWDSRSAWLLSACFHEGSSLWPQDLFSHLQNNSIRPMI